MSDNLQPPGLWFSPGDAVLARQRDVILLSSLGVHGLAEKFLDGLATIASDGSGFARHVQDVIEMDDSWRAGPGNEQHASVVAIGPACGGMTIAVSGMAWAEITTVHGVQRIQAGQPSMLLHCVLGMPPIAVHAGLGTDIAELGIDRFSRLDGGTVRAAGFSYYRTHAPICAARADAVVAPEPFDALAARRCRVRCGRGSARAAIGAAGPGRAG